MNGNDEASSSGSHALRDDDGAAQGSGDGAAPFTSMQPAQPQEISSEIMDRRQSSTRTVSELPDPTLITYGSKSVRARIDRNVGLNEVIRQLCASQQLSVQAPASQFALRDATTNELISPDNMARLLDQGSTLKLVPAPAIEAAQLVEKLRGQSSQALKQATFSLRSFIREEAFVHEFQRLQGASALADVIESNTGNTLAYALSGLQSLLDVGVGLDELHEDTVRRVTKIASTETLVNIVRPALAILRKLLASNDSRFGFDNVWRILAEDDQLFAVTARRIVREGDKHLISGALALVNAILKHASKMYFFDVFDKLELHGYRKAVISLIENHAEDVTPYILQFQQGYANLWHQQQVMPVKTGNPRHLAVLRSIYKQAGLSTPDVDVDPDFRNIGFSGNAPELEADFRDVGVFGLLALHNLSSSRTEDFSRMVLEQVNRTEARRCPIARVSLQVSRILAEQFDLSGSLASTSFQPFLLDYYRIHFIVIEFFIRMFQESGATVNDFSRVSDLTTSQVRVTLGQAGMEGNGGSEPKSFFAVKQELEDAEYEQVRDRQLKELEVEDDLQSKLPVRNLRDRLYRENFAFVRAQRINCLLRGAWFTNAGYTGSILATSQRQRASPSTGGKLRFCRLSPNRRFLHYVDAADKRAIRPGLDDLPDRIDLSSVTEVTNGLSQRSLSLQQTRSQTSVPSAVNGSLSSPRSPVAAAPASQNASSHHQKQGSSLASAQSSSPHHPFSVILLNNDAVLADMVAPDASTLSEWIDGLNLLLPDGFIATKETAEYVQTLTDIGVKVRLLDLTGEKLEIPTALPVPIVPPASVPFFYAD